MERINVAGPSITQKEIDYVTDAVTNAWYGNAYYYHRRFESAFASYLGVKYALSLPSCTSAIHLSLAVLDIGKGDEVIIPDITWIATAAPVCYVGATPVFADIDEKSWCLSANSFEQCITSKTKAVIPVDLYGGIPDMDEIREIAQQYQIAIIEDAAEAIGTEYKSKKAGSFGDTGVFSFHGSKTLTTGEGGMLVTDREDIYKRAVFLGDHGRQSGEKMFWNSEVAFKYKMSSMQAALGLAQLERIDELITLKRNIFHWYQEQFSGIEGITLNQEMPGTKNTYWMVTLILDPSYQIEKEEMIAYLEAHHIASRPFFYPLSSLPAFRNLEGVKMAKERNSVSYRLSPYGINLPCGLDMNRRKVDYVCSIVKKKLGLRTT